MKTLFRTFIITLFIVANTFITAYGQSYNADKTELSNFLSRMYKSAPFEGVKVITDYDNSYLLSVLSLDKAKYPNQSVINRVASVKAMSQASQFLNGSSISTEMIIRTTERSDGTIDSEILENIKENSIGYVKSLELLTNFEGRDGKSQIFMFVKKLEK